MQTPSSLFTSGRSFALCFCQPFSLSALITYIIMRGLVNNESLAMFMFITHVAWPYLHPKHVLRCVRAHISDGKDEQLRALWSMCLPDGDSPHAKVLRCAWHIVNRAMYRIFGSASKDWQRTFEKIFWIWQSQETLNDLKNFYDWIIASFFTSPIILGDMSGNEIALVDTFLGGIWSTRDSWSVAHNLEVEAFDLRVNTFTEAQFSVLTQHVGISATMSAPTFVRAEDMAQLHRHQKLLLQNFKQATRAVSHAGQKTKWFSHIEELFCPQPLKIARNEVELASSCCRSPDSRWSLCDKHDCVTCRTYLTPFQKQHLGTAGESIKIHMKCRLNELRREVKFANLPTAFQNVVRSAPTKKHWRVVTCHRQQHGWLLLCSCGWSKRNMMCCLHCSIVIQKATNFACCGCEEESLCIRHTHAFAGIQDKELVQRTHDDWQGVFTTMLNAKAIHDAFPPVSTDDSNASNASEPGNIEDNHDHVTRHAARSRQAFQAARARKSEALGKWRAHFQEICNIVEVEQNEHEFDRLIQHGDDILLAWRRALPPIASRVATVRARRPHQEERRMGPRSGPKGKSMSRAKKISKEAAAPKSFKRPKHGIGAGNAADPVTIRSESSAAASSLDDPDSEVASSVSSFTRLSLGFHYSDGYSSEDSSSGN